MKYWRFFLLLWICWAASTDATYDEGEEPGPAVISWIRNGYNSVNNFFGGSNTEVQPLRQDHDALCGDDLEPLAGTCSNLATCLVSSGTRVTTSSSCGPFGMSGVCCKHTHKCGGHMNTRVAFWESEDYPDLSSRAGGCTLRVTPVNDVCYIRIQFEDAILTAPRSGVCEGNSLSIRGQFEGSGGSICGNLNGYETFIKVNEGTTGGILRTYDDLVMHMDIEDELHKYRLKLTQIKCDQHYNSPIKEDVHIGESLEASERMEKLGIKTHWNLRKTKVNHRMYSVKHKSAARRRMKRQQRWSWFKNAVGSIPQVVTVIDLTRPTVTSRRGRAFKKVGENSILLEKTYNEQDQIETLKLLTKINDGDFTSAKNPEVLNKLNTTITGIFASSGISDAGWEIISINDVSNVLKSKDLTLDEKKSFIRSLRRFAEKMKPENRSIGRVKLGKQSRSRGSDILSSLSSIIDEYSDNSRRNQPVIKRKAQTEVKIGEDISVREIVSEGMHEDGFVVLISPLRDLANTMLENRNRFESFTNDGKDSLIMPNVADANRKHLLESALKTLQETQADIIRLGLDTESDKSNNMQSQINNPSHATKMTADEFFSQNGKPESNIKISYDDFQIKLPHKDQKVIEKPNIATQFEATSPELEYLKLYQSSLNKNEKMYVNNKLVDKKDAVKLSQSSDEDRVTKAILTASDSEKEKFANTKDDKPPKISVKYPAVDHIEADVSYYGYLILNNELDEYFFCSASLITPRHVLTTASCVMRKGYDAGKYKTRVVFSHEDLGPARLRSGKQLYNSEDRHKVTKTVFHPMYRHGRFHFDIAVLELANEIKDIAPIKVASTLQFDELNREEITIMGHGVKPGTRSLDFGSYEQFLSYISTKQVSTGDCVDNYLSSPRRRFTYPQTLIKPELLCVSSDDDTQICEGDMGAPAVINFKGPGAPILVGVAAGNDHNCIDVQESEMGAFPDVVVRITPDIRKFIVAATSNIRVS